MGYSKHPIGRRVDIAIDHLRANGTPLTPANVRDNALARITLQQFDPMAAVRVQIDHWIRQRMRARGFVIKSPDGERKELRDCTPDEHREQMEIRERNFDHIRRHLRAGKAVQEFLELKRDQLGREVTVGEFAPEVEAIFADHGCELVVG